MGNRESGTLRKIIRVCTIPACLRFLFAMLLAANGAVAQAASNPQPLPPDPRSSLEVSLLTFGPGEIYWERFGHNAILIRDRAAGTAIAYNYGIFDFEQKDFLLNFARGRMRYRIAADNLADDLDLYAEEGRWVIEQRLNLTPPQRSALADFLAWNARPEHAYYDYDYFTANCSTQVRDALDRALGGALKRQSEGRSRGYTYRIDADRLLEPEPLLMLGMDLGLGPFADRRLDFWAEGFVPMVLMQVVRQVQVRDADGHTVPLVAGETRLVQGRLPDPPDLPTDLRVPFLILGLALGGGLLWLGQCRERRTARILWSACASLFALFCTLGGLLLIVLWTLTEHRAAWRNENLLLLDPLCLLLIPAWLGAARARWQPGRFGIRVAWLVAVIAAFALFSKVLPWFPQANLQWIVLFLPIHAALARTAARAATEAA